MSGNKVFFEHINGLRGLAIILVVLFHLSSDTFPCCFYGVDIFLVITGYLLFIGLKKQEGSLMGSAVFAMKRAARILPPVAVLVFLTLCAGFFLLDYQDNIAASRLGRYTLFGMANVHLNKEASDYFAADFSDNPLMHMWYIGVTLQVYLMFILGNAICKRIPRRVWLPSLFAVAAVSLALRYCWSFDLLQLLGLSGKGNMTEPSYFETLPRVWEVMAGGLVCLLPDVSSRFRANVLTICGFVAVLLPVVLLRESSSAMFPVVVAGTVLIIRYYPHSSLTVLLCNRLLMFVGTISFSLYMVHLPVFVCYKSWAFREMGEVDYVVMLLLSFLFAWGYYKLVERPKWNWKVWVAVWLAVLFACVLVKKVDGFKGMLQSDADCQLLPEYTMWSGDVDSDLFRGYDKNLLKADTGVFVIMETPSPEEEVYFLRIGDPTRKPVFVLLGDSHAQSLYPGLNEVCSRGEDKRSGVYLASIISPFWNIEIPALSSKSPYYCNRSKMEALLHWLEVHPDLKYVVISQYWIGRMENTKYDWDKNPADRSTEAHAECLRQFLIRLKAIGKQPVLVAPTPDFAINPVRGARLCNRRGGGKVTNKSFGCSYDKYMKRHGKIVAMLKKMESEGLASIIEPALTLSPGEPFRAYENGKLYFRDRNHLSVTGSTVYVEKLKSRFLELISE